MNAAEAIANAHDWFHNNSGWAPLSGRSNGGRSIQQWAGTGERHLLLGGPPFRTPSCRVLSQVARWSCKLSFVGIGGDRFGPVMSEVRQPLRVVELDIGERSGAVVGERSIEELRPLTPGPGVTEHHLEQGGARLARPQRPEGGPEWKFDVGPGRTSTLTDPELSVDHEHDVRAVVTVTTHDHPGVIPGVEREVLGLRREREPLLPHRRLSAVGVLLSTDLLPRDVRIIEMAERGFESRNTRLRWHIVRHDVTR